MKLWEAKKIACSWLMWSMMRLKHLARNCTELNWILPNYGTIRFTWTPCVTLILWKKVNVCDEVWFHGQVLCFKGLQLIMDNDTGIALVDGFEANTHEACTEAPGSCTCSSTFHPIPSRSGKSSSSKLPTDGALLPITLRHQKHWSHWSNFHVSYMQSLA